MIICSVITGIISMCGGLLAAAAFSLPTGPTIVLTAAILFILAASRGILQSR